MTPFSVRVSVGFAGRLAAGGRCRHSPHQEVKCMCGSRISGTSAASALLSVLCVRVRVRACVSVEWCQRPSAQRMRFGAVCIGGHQREDSRKQRTHTHNIQKHDAHKSAAAVGCCAPNSSNSVGNCMRALCWLRFVHYMLDDAAFSSLFTATPATMYACSRRRWQSRFTRDFVYS